ncbi:MAG: hypothetical protein A3B67_13095 [Burkholderiales bacterium RIFCSPHIGHO2_02_FULL_66_10]|nr:MAG: hypothetical protein A3B67_13095 [Burkholderiales bacterium RIFCSPHIGHO2_02_FULL_66_10]
MAGGSSAQVWADSTIKPARSSAERRAMGSITSQTNASTTSSSTPMKARASNTVFWRTRPTDRFTPDLPAG